MPLMIAIPDDCKPLAKAVERLVACTDGASKRASGGRAWTTRKLEREVGERTAEVERAAHQRILTALDVDAATVVIDGGGVELVQASPPDGTRPTWDDRSAMPAVLDTPAVWPFLWPLQIVRE